MLGVRCAVVGLVAVLAGCQPQAKPEKKEKDKHVFAPGGKKAAPFDPANATALKVGIMKGPIIRDGHYAPGSWVQLAASATMKDGTTYDDRSIWKSLDAKASFGTVTVRDDLIAFTD